MSDDCRFLENPYHFAGREIEPLSGRLVFRGDAGHLSARQIRILGMLLAGHGEVVSRRDLIDANWPTSSLSGERGLSETIYRLRRLLKDDDANRPLIRTVPRVGYMVPRCHQVHWCAGETSDPSRSAWSPRLVAWRIAALVGMVVVAALSYQESHQDGLAPTWLAELAQSVRSPAGQASKIDHLRLPESSQVSAVMENAELQHSRAMLALNLGREGRYGAAAPALGILRAEEAGTPTSTVDRGWAALVIANEVCSESSGPPCETALARSDEQAEKSGDLELMAEAARVNGLVQFHQGSPQIAARYLEQAYGLMSAARGALDLETLKTLEFLALARMMSGDLLHAAENLKMLSQLEASAAGGPSSRSIHAKTKELWYRMLAGDVDYVRSELPALRLSAAGNPAAMELVALTDYGFAIQTDGCASSPPRIGQVENPLVQRSLARIAAHEQILCDNSQLAHIVPAKQLQRVAGRLDIAMRAGGRRTAPLTPSPS